MRYSDLEAGDVYDRINKELNDLLNENKEVPNEIFFKAANLFSQAVRTKNPYYSDLGQALCLELDFPPTNTMQIVASTTAQERLKGTPSGTIDQIKRNGKNQTVAGWMAHLIAAGNGVKIASEKAASLFEVNFPNDKPKQASSISQFYEKSYRYINILGRTQQEIINELHEANPNLKTKWALISRNTDRTKKNQGNRRE